jgi:hypothetical protein
LVHRCLLHRRGPGNAREDGRTGCESRYAARPPCRSVHLQILDLWPVFEWPGRKHERAGCRANPYFFDTRSFNRCQLHGETVGYPMFYKTQKFKLGFLKTKSNLNRHILQARVRIKASTQLLTNAKFSRCTISMNQLDSVPFNQTVMVWG